MPDTPEVAARRELKAKCQALIDALHLVQLDLASDPVRWAEADKGLAFTIFHLAKLRGEYDAKR